MSKTPQIVQLPLPMGHTCHFKGCAEPVVGASLISSKAYVCDTHNKLEWAKALSRGKDGYWRMFGKRWLAELTGREVSA